MTPEQRKRWEVTRARGYNRFLLTPDWSALLGGWIGVTLAFWQSRYGFSLDALRTGEFWAWAGTGLFGIYVVKCFVKMFTWRHNELEYLASTEGEESSPPK
jgi:hypothetical protein